MPDPAASARRRFGAAGPHVARERAGQRLERVKAQGELRGRARILARERLR